MNRLTLLLVAFTVAVSAGLKLAGVDLPGEAWGLVGGVVGVGIGGVAIKRPHDVTGADVARALESVHPSPDLP